jgi:putative transposase
MARAPRIQAPNAIYHVWSRAARSLMLYVDDEDRKAFHAIVGIAVAKADWICHAYCQVGTHYHLILQTPEPNIGVGMKRLNWLYSRTFNDRYGMKGHLFESRYGTELIQSHEHFINAYRYVTLNPVEAGIVESPLDWPWSSYPATIGLAPLPRFLTTHVVLEALNPRPDVARRQLRWIVEGLDPQLAAA